MADYKSSGIGGGKMERDIYYRRPMTGEQPGWITTGAQASGTSMRDYSMRGFTPLWDYGSIPHGEANTWATILNHPKGPSEFPVEQILTLRWYKEPPVEGVSFPQLEGHKVVEMKCPECSREAYVEIDGKGGAIHLARHLRIMHKWEAAEVIKYGDASGIDFSRVYSKDEVQQTIEFGAAVGCDECDYVAPGDSKRPEAAVRMHKMSAHKALEVVEA